MNMGEVIFWPVAAVLVMFVAIVMIFLVPQMTANADRVTRAEISKTEVQTILAASMKPRREKMSNYDRISYTISGKEKSIREEPIDSTASNLPYFLIETRGEVSQEIFKRGEKTGRRDAAIFKVLMPMRGGKTVRLAAESETLEQ